MRWLVAFALAVAAGGCTRGAARRDAPVVLVVDEAPPEPRAERVEMKDGHVWVRGIWQRFGDEWVWRAGHWLRERPGSVWRDAHWTLRAGRWHWVDGRWSR